MKKLKGTLTEKEILKWLDSSSSALEECGEKNSKGRDYLKILLLTVFEDGDGFSGKRPFGNSDWRQDIYASLISVFPWTGTLDSDGNIEDCSEDLLERYIFHIINYIFKKK